MKRKEFSEIIALGVIKIIHKGIEKEESDEMLAHVVTNYIDHHLDFIGIDEIAIETFLNNL